MEHKLFREVNPEEFEGRFNYRVIVYRRMRGDEYAFVGTRRK